VAVRLIPGAGRNRRYPYAIVYVQPGVATWLGRACQLSLALSVSHKKKDVRIVECERETTNVAKPHRTYTIPHALYQHSTSTESQSQSNEQVVRGLRNCGKSRANLGILHSRRCSRRPTRSPRPAWSRRYGVFCISPKTVHCTVSCKFSPEFR